MRIARSGARVPTVLREVEFRCWPITLRRDASAVECELEDGMLAEFASLSFEALTSFFAFEVRAQVGVKRAERRFVLKLPLEGAPEFKNYLYKELENIYGGMWDCEPDPVKHAQKMIAHIDKKRKALGIDKARERVLMDMEDRQKMDASYLTA